jgi:diketogulonate reductase-like aldo/keto reductase
LFEPTTPLIDEIDVSNWAIDDIEELEDFQTNPPSFDAKQTHIFEKKQD